MPLRDVQVFWFFIITIFCALNAVRNMACKRRRLGYWDPPDYHYILGFLWAPVPLGCIAGAVHWCIVFHHPWWRVFS